MPLPPLPRATAEMRRCIRSLSPQRTVRALVARHRAAAAAAAALSYCETEGAARVREEAPPVGKAEEAAVAGQPGVWGAEVLVEEEERAEAAAVAVEANASGVAATAAEEKVAAEAEAEAEETVAAEAEWVVACEMGGFSRAVAAMAGYHPHRSLILSGRSPARLPYLRARLCSWSEWPPRRTVETHSTRARRACRCVFAAARLREPEALVLHLRPPSSPPHHLPPPGCTRLAPSALVRGRAARGRAVEAMATAASMTMATATGAATGAATAGTSGARGCERHSPRWHKRRQSRAPHPAQRTAPPPPASLDRLEAQAAPAHPGAPPPPRGGSRWPSQPASACAVD